MPLPPYHNSKIEKLVYNTLMCNVCCLTSNNAIHTFVLHECGSVYSYVQSLNYMICRMLA